jgi:putative ABC transport system permease protein
VRAEFSIVGRDVLSPTDVPAAQNRYVSPGYFQTMGIPILKGREFTPHDNSSGAAVVVIDETLANHYWPGENAVGAHLRLDDGEPTPREVEIVGVAGKVKHVGLDSESTTTVYAPLDQIPESTVPFLAGNMSLVVRTSSNPQRLADGVRREVQSVDRDVPASSARTMEQFLTASVAPRRFNVILLAVFAGAALLLAVSGIYAVMAYSVVHRIHEIGIRMALGAQQSHVLKMVLGQGLRLALIGIALGLVGALALTRFISSLLFGISFVDPLTFVTMPLLFIVVALAACYVPARKATKVNPVIALRLE